MQLSSTMSTTAILSDTAPPPPGYDRTSPIPPDGQVPAREGWAIGGTWVYGVIAPLWAGLVRPRCSTTSPGA